MTLTRIHKGWINYILLWMEVKLLRYNTMVDSRFALRRIDEIRAGFVFVCTYQKNECSYNEWTEFVRTFQLHFNKNLEDICGEEFFPLRKLLFHLCKHMEDILRNNDMSDEKKIEQILICLRFRFSDVSE